MAGTGLYAVDKTPVSHNDTQSGAPAGQVITLTTGGIGTTTYAGGYVSNTTETETRAIVSHTNTTITLEGDLTNWTDGDTLVVYEGWTKINDALAQLLTDQSTATFTSSQVIRVLDSETYNETVSPSGSLAPQPRYRLIIEAASGQTPTITGQGLTYAIDLASAIEFVIFDSFIVAGACTGNGVVNSAAFQSRSIYFKNCVLRGSSATSIWLNGQVYSGMYFEDCEIDGSDGITIFISFQGMLDAAIRCYIHDLSSYFIRSTRRNFTLEGCTIENVGTVIGTYPVADYTSKLYARNNTFYNVTNVVENAPVYAFDQLVFINNICHTVTGYVFGDDRDASKFDHGGDIKIDGNIYYNVAKWYSSFTETDITTFAAWQARGHDANGSEQDPGLADPANGDFSITSSSAAYHAGIGSGVPTGINEVAFDLYHPDVGSYSTGVLTSPTAPIITSATDEKNGTKIAGGDITLSLVAANATDVLYVYYGPSPSIDALTLWPTSRTGSGELTLTGMTYQEPTYFVAVASQCGSPCDVVSGPSNIVKGYATSGVSSIEWWIQKAVFDALTSDADLMAAITGVYDFAPQDTPAPYVFLGDDTVIDWDTMDEVGNEVTIGLHVYSDTNSGKEGRKEAKQIEEHIYRILHNRQLAIAGYDDVLMQLSSTNTSREPDGHTVHGIVNYTALARRT